jgi:hypothetical protein
MSEEISLPIDINGKNYPAPQGAVLMTSRVTVDAADEISRLRVIENDVKKCYGLAKAGKQLALEDALVNLFMTVAPPEERLAMYASHIQETREARPRHSRFYKSAGHASTRMNP